MNNRTITPDELKPLVEKHAVFVLDVRRRADYEADSLKLPCSQWKDPEQITAWSAMLPKEKDIVIYCARGGSVSNATLDHLLGQGFKARYIAGGIEAWKAAGGATVAKRP